jgi:hypothetical protein
MERERLDLQKPLFSGPLVNLPNSSFPSFSSPHNQNSFFPASTSSSFPHPSLTSPPTAIPADLLAEAIKTAETNGIIFLDEIDKLITPPNVTKSGGEASAEGVAKDLLPLVGGCTIMTPQFGPINTSKILFIAAGAFSSEGVTPALLLPELSGRLPLKVALHALTDIDYYNILTKTQNSLLLQYVCYLSLLYSLYEVLGFSDELMDFAHFFVFFSLPFFFILFILFNSNQPQLPLHHCIYPGSTDGPRRY